jgi:hypothetical protein
MNKTQARALGATALTVAVPGALVILAGFALYRFGKRVVAGLPSSKVRHLEKVAYRRPVESA